MYLDLHVEALGALFLERTFLALRSTPIRDPSRPVCCVLVLLGLLRARASRGTHQ